jgi:hypothetical protein
MHMDGPHIHGRGEQDRAVTITTHSTVYKLLIQKINHQVSAHGSQDSANISESLTQHTLHLLTHIHSDSCQESHFTVRVWCVCARAGLRTFLYVHVSVRVSCALVCAYRYVLARARAFACVCARVGR